MANLFSLPHSQTISSCNILQTPWEELFKTFRKKLNGQWHQISWSSMSLATARPVTAASLPKDCCPELGRSCLQVSRLQECLGTCCFLRGDHSPVWYYGCLLHCCLLNCYWRAARRSLVFLKLDIPPRHGQKATSSGVYFFQKQLPLPKTCQKLFHAPGRHFSLLGLSILLYITPATSAKSGITYPFNKKFSSWDRLLLIACISDVSAAHNCGSLLVTFHLFLKK